MSTAWQLYNRPDPLEDEPEPHSWDGEAYRLWRWFGDGGPEPGPQYTPRPEFDMVGMSQDPEGNWLYTPMDFATRKVLGIPRKASELPEYIYWHREEITDD